MCLHTHGYHAQLGWKQSAFTTVAEADVPNIGIGANKLGFYVQQCTDYSILSIREKIEGPYICNITIFQLYEVFTFDDRLVNLTTKGICWVPSYTK